MAKSSVPKEVLLDGAQMSLTALIVGTISFLKQRGLPVKSWVSYIGEQFDGALADLEGEEISEVMSHLLTLELMPMGVEVLSTQATTDKVEVEVSSLPSQSVLEKFGTTPKELLKGFGVTKREFASMYAMYEPAAKAIGLKFSHRSKDGRDILILERAASKRRAQ